MVQVGERAVQVAPSEITPLEEAPF